MNDQPSTVEELNKQRAQLRASVVTELEAVDEQYWTGRLPKKEHGKRRAVLEGRMRGYVPVSPAAEVMSGPPLSWHFARLLVEGDHKEDVMYRIAFGALCADWTQERLKVALLDPNNLGGGPLQLMAAKSGTASDRELGRLWWRAEEYASMHPDKVAEVRALARLTHVQVVADALVWKGEAALTDLCSLHAFLYFGRLNTKTTVGMSARALSQHVGVTPKTANLSTQRLRLAGWLRHKGRRAANPAHAAEFEIGLPMDAPPVRLALPPIPLEVASSPAFFRSGIGKAGLRMLQVMGSQPDRWWTVRDLTFVTALTPSVIRRQLEALLRDGLADRDDSEGVCYQADINRLHLPALGELAMQYGTAEVARHRGMRLTLEREGFAEVLRSRPSLLRQRSGKSN